jgi:hypothetical protein
LEAELQTLGRQIAPSRARLRRICRHISEQHNTLQELWDRIRATSLTSQELCEKILDGPSECAVEVPKIAYYD